MTVVSFLYFNQFLNYSKPLIKRLGILINVQ